MNSDMIGKKELNFERQTWLDFLRIIASIAVVRIHVSQQIWYCTDINSIEWIFSNFFEATSKYGVPVFVMISGAGILGYSEISCKKIVEKISKFVKILFLVGDLLY